MPLSPYRRHSANCKQSSKGQNFTNKCTCTIWCYGTLGGRPVRESLNTRDWTIASKLIAQKETEPTSPGHAVTIADAVNSYLDDCHARRLAPATITSYENILAAFLDHCTRHNLRELRGLRMVDFSNFRASRKVASSTQRKEIEHLRALCRFCKDHDWIQKNFAADLRPPREAAPVTMPYERDEIQKLLAACDRIENFNRAGAERARKRARALILLLLYSGLRVSDAMRVRRDQLNEKGKLRLRAMKTGIDLYIPLHLDCLTALQELPHESPYFLWSGESKLSTATGSARRTVDCISRLSGVKARPHRFRDTFAVELLLAGEDIRTVQLLLGHESLKTTERHYAPYTRRMQDRLDAAASKLHFGGE